MRKKTHFVFTILAASFVMAFTAAPYVSHATAVTCAPDDTRTGCTCNVNGYTPEAIAGDANVNQPAPGIVQPGDYIVSSEDSTSGDD